MKYWKMRNTLVLVPLCIGLTYGFIVSTSTTEVYVPELRISTSSEELLNITEEVSFFNHSSLINFTKSEVTQSLHSHHPNEDDIKKELYSEVAKDNKKISERSFVFVNQRWKKLPYKSYLVKTNPVKGNKKGIAHVNVLKNKGNTDANYFTDKQGIKMDYIKVENKSFLSPTRTLENQINLNRVSIDKDFDKRKFFEGNLKRPLLRHPGDSNEGLHLSRNYHIKADDRNIKRTDSESKKHFLELLKVNHNYHEDSKNKGGMDSWKMSKSPLSKLEDELKNDDISMSVNRLYHLLLEEQVPDKQQVYNYNNSSVSNLRYCQKCNRLAYLKKLNNRSLNECECICGRYIYIKGRPDLKDKIKNDKKNVFFNATRWKHALT